MFYEQWSPYINRQMLPGDLISSYTSTNYEIRQLTTAEFPIDNFMAVGFTNHVEILSKIKDFDERLFYISQCAHGSWEQQTDMEIKYEVHSIENSQGTGESRPFIQLRNIPAMTAEELARAIEEACSVTASDVKAVMSEICHIAKRELSSGSRFYLPEIGYLSLAVSNTPPSKKPNGKLTGKDIYLRNINFKPEKKFLKEVQRNVHFTKSDYTTLSAKYTEETLWAKISEYLSAHRYITRRAMRSEFGLSDYKANQWLTKFVEGGKLTKEGTRHLPLYFPSC